MMVDVVGGILLAGLTLYAALGGADFGGGLWDLLAGADQRGRAPRQLIDDTITPVWEANHVWLIFVLVIFWTAFPPAFAAVMTAAALPLWLAAFGIVLRGAGFAFRKEVETLHWQRLFGAAFAFSSLIVPFFMGTVIGAIASGRIPATPARTDLAVWTGPTSLLIGALFVAVCALSRGGVLDPGGQPPRGSPAAAVLRGPRRHRRGRLRSALTRRHWRRSTPPTRPCSTGSPTGPCRWSSSRRPAGSPSWSCWPPGAPTACARCRSWAWRPSCSAGAWPSLPCCCPAPA